MGGGIFHERTLTLKLYTYRGGQGIQGVTMKSSRPDEYIVAIDNTMNHTERLASFLHEMTHIYNGDLDTEGGDVNEIESRTNRQLLEALRCLQEREREA